MAPCATSSSAGIRSRRSRPRAARRSAGSPTSTTTRRSACSGRSRPETARSARSARAAARSSASGASARCGSSSRAPSSELALFWLDAYGGGVFLPFADATRGRETYGGGRYLLDTVKGADLGEEDGRLVLDFNFAYNPSCSYDPRWVCPLSPPENRLPVAVRAGEQHRS